MKKLLGNCLLNTRPLPWYRAGGAPAPDVVYQFPDGVDYASSCVNVINPGMYNAIAGVNPAWAAGVGVTFNGTTQWLNSQYIPGIAATMIIRIGAVTVATRTIAGIYTTPAFRIRARSTNNPEYFVGDGSSEGFDPPANGTLAVSKILNIPTGSYGYGYQNGAPSIDLPSTINTASAFPIFLGAANTAGVATNFCAVNIKYFAAWPANLSDAMIAAIHAAVMLK